MLARNHMAVNEWLNKNKSPIFFFVCVYFVDHSVHSCYFDMNTAGARREYTDLQTT